MIWCASSADCSRPNPKLLRATHELFYTQSVLIINCCKVSVLVVFTTALSHITLQQAVMCVRWNTDINTLFHNWLIVINALSDAPGCDCLIIGGSPGSRDVWPLRSIPDILQPLKLKRIRDSDLASIWKRLLHWVTIYNNFSFILFTSLLTSQCTSPSEAQGNIVAELWPCSPAFCRLI